MLARRTGIATWFDRLTMSGCARNDRWVANFTLTPTLSHQGRGGRAWAGGSGVATSMGWRNGRWVSVLRQAQDERGRGRRCEMSGIGGRRDIDKYRLSIYYVFKVLGLQGNPTHPSPMETIHRQHRRYEVVSLITLNHQWHFPCKRPVGQGIAI